MTGLVDADVAPVTIGRGSARRARSRRGHRARRAAGLFAVIVFLGTLGYLVSDQVHRHDRYDHAQSSLRVTREHTALVTAELRQLRHDLELLSTKVGDDSTTLEQDMARLKGAQWALALTQADVTKQSSQIASLQTCLGGVEKALNSVAAGNPNGAARELDAVSSSCTAAEAAHG